MRKKVFLKLNILLSIILCFLQVIIFSNQKNNVMAKTNTIYGNDISHWQKDVDFNKMKKVSNYVIIRIGYSTKLDSRFLEYMTNAKKANIPIGIYIYSLATTPQEAQNEAHWVASILSIHNFDKGYIDYPIFFDYEEASFITSNSKKYNTQIINAFTDTISSYGYYPGLYMGGYYFENHINKAEINCDVWLAHYFNNMKDVNKFKQLHPSTNITMWQFGADGYNTLYSGSDCGVSSDVIDENYCFVDYPAIISKGGYNGHEIATPNIPQEKPPIIDSSTANSSQTQVENSSSLDKEEISSSEDLPVFKPQQPLAPSKGGCNSSLYPILGFIFVPLSIYSVIKLIKKEP